MCIALAIAPAGAETITGTIYDEQARVVAGVRVMLMQDYVKQRETKADEAGNFSFTDVAPGMYQVQAKQPRFGIWQQTVMLEAGQSPRLYAILQVARVDERIQINSARVGDTAWTPTPLPPRAGGRMEGPRLLSGGRPPYPPDAGRRGVEGAVVLAATIKADGTVDSINTLASPDPALEAAAREDFKKWRYAPMTLNGQPVECGITLVLAYKLR